MMNNLRRFISIAILAVAPLTGQAQRQPVADSVAPWQGRVDEVMHLIDGFYTETPDMERMST